MSHSGIFVHFEVIRSRSDDDIIHVGQRFLTSFRFDHWSVEFFLAELIKAGGRMNEIYHFINSVWN